MYTRVSLSEQVPLSRPPLCNSLSERTRYRNVLVIRTNCSDNEYTKCLCNVLVIRTILSSDNEYVLVIGTYSLSEQIVLITSMAGRTHYLNKTVLVIRTYSLSELKVVIGTICSDNEYKTHTRYRNNCSDNEYERIYLSEQTLCSDNESYSL